MPTAPHALPAAPAPAADEPLPGRWAAAAGLLGSVALGLLAWQGAAAGGTAPGTLALLGVAAPLLLGTLAWRARRRAGADAARLQAQIHTLTRREQQLRLAEQVVQLGSFDWNPVSGALHWSDQHYRLWGLAPGSLVPSYEVFRRGVHADDVAALEAQLQRSLHDGLPYDCQHRVVWPDGTVRDIHARGEVQRDRLGTAVRMIGTVQDITARRQAEARLATHEFVVNTIADPVSVMDGDGVFHLVNDAWCRNTGLDRAQVVGQPPGSFVMPALNPKRDEALRRCIGEDRVQVVQAEFALPTLGLRWWETTLFPYHGLGGGRRGAVLVTRDVTARQAAQVALAASVDNLQLTLNATGDAIFASNAHAPNEPLLFVNDRMLQLWAIPPERAAQLTPAEVMAFARPLFIDPAREFARVAEVIASGQPQEDRLELRDGRVLLRRCIPTLEAGRPLRVWGFRDITAEARAQQRLHDAEARQRALLAAFPGYIACIDADQRYTYVNALLAARLGSTPQALVGRPVAEVVGPDRAALMARRIARVLDGEVLSFEHHHPATADLPELHVLQTLARGLDGATGRPVCYAFGTDITARKRTEAALVAARDEAERANQAKSDFLSSMSHELRTPMNSVLGFAQLLEADTTPPLTPPQRAQVREILHGGRHLLTLINDLLDLARIEADRLVVQCRPVPVQAVLAECAALLAPLAERHAVQVRLPAPSGPVLCMLADRTRLCQVVLNLLGNAIKFNRAGGWVQLHCDRTDGQVRVAVADDGPGITPAAQARLFQRFERLDADAGPVEGAGIGLALSQRLAQLMGGEIGLLSAPGQGSTFWLSLPAAEAADGAVPEDAAAPRPVPLPAPLPLPVPAAPAGAAPRRVLYIEDNPVNTLLMVALFERLPGVVLKCAALPQAGLAMALAEPPDLVLVDIQMPGMDGYAVLRRLREAPATTQVPVIAVSANATAQDLARGRAAGFADYLTKPLELPRLLAAVDAALSAGAAAA